MGYISLPTISAPKEGRRAWPRHKKKSCPSIRRHKGRQLAEPILPAGRSSLQLTEATPRRFLAAQARGSSHPAGRRVRPQPA